MIDKNTIPKYWKVQRFFELLDYKQPTNYIVKSTDYNENYKTPVLTAGKTFIIGYTDEKIGIYSDLPVIIFDDFTTATQFVTFSFKVKSSAMKILKPKNENVNIKFIFYFMQTIHLKNETHKRYWISEYSKLMVPIPPLSVQHHIVTKIEELFSELDKGKQQLEAVKQQLKIYRQAVLKWAFEGRFTSPAGTVRDLSHDEHNKPQLPEGWRMGTIIELAEKNKNALKAGPFGSSLKKEFYVESGYKIYGQEQVISGNAFLGDYYVSREKFEELESNKVKPNDVLISLVGTVGKVLILPENCQDGIINPRLIKISLDKEIYLPKFFKYYFESSKVKSFYSKKAQGTTMDVLNLSIIKTIPFPICSVEDQNLIINEIESRLSICDKIEEIIETSLKQAESLRQSILKQAFEGRLIKI